MPSRMRSANCAGVPPITAKPAASKIGSTSGACSALLISVLSRATIGAGSPGGPKKPNHDDGLRKAGMISDMDGTSGSFA